MQTCWVGIRSALVEMRTHKLRSFLSLLGVMLGVAALVAMLSLIGGIQVYLRDTMGELAGSLWVWRNWQRPETPAERLAWSRSPGLRFSDSEYLVQESGYVTQSRDVIERRGSATIAAEGVRGVRLRGVTPLSFADDTSEVVLDKGRLFTNGEFLRGDPVVLVSWRIVERAARALRRSGRDTSAILGSTLRYGSTRFTIIGTLRPRDPDNQPRHAGMLALTPLVAMQKYVTGYDPDPGTLFLKVSDPERLEAQSRGVARDLTARHRGVEDFLYRGADWVENMSSSLANISLVMGIVSVVSLVVGGMGIMNVMLSSISERIREIGVRKALGATNGQIFVQFLAETVTLSVAGGLAGAAIGLSPVYAFADAIRQSSQGAMTPTVLAHHAVVVLITIMGVGVLFGLYPALKAARMDPIDALRYE